MVNEMDLEERKALHAEAKAQSQLVLDADAYRAAIAEQRSTEVVRRSDPEAEPVKVSAEDSKIEFLLSYRGNDPGLLWRKGNAEREQARRQDITDRREQEVRKLLSQHQARPDFIDSRVATKLAEHDEIRRDAHGKLISDDRKRFRKLEERIEGLALRLDAMTHETTKRQIIEDAVRRRGPDRGEIVDMVVPMERSRRRAG